MMIIAIVNNIRYHLLSVTICQILRLILILTTTLNMYYPYFVGNEIKAKRSYITLSMLHVKKLQSWGTE